jgi:hypothetical protein
MTRVEAKIVQERTKKENWLKGQRCKVRLWSRKYAMLPNPNFNFLTRQPVAIRQLEPTDKVAVYMYVYPDIYKYGKFYEKTAKKNYKIYDKDLNYVGLMKCKPTHFIEDTYNRMRPMSQVETLNALGRGPSKRFTTDNTLRNFLERK